MSAAAAPPLLSADLMQRLQTCGQCHAVDSSVLCLRFYVLFPVSRCRTCRGAPGGASAVEPTHGGTVYCSNLPAALSTVQLFTLDASDVETLLPFGSIQHNNDIFVPVQLIEGDSSDSAPARVIFQSATRVKQFVTRLPPAELEQLQAEQRRKTDAEAIIRELQEALPRNADAIQAAVAAAADGSGDLNDIGALTIEQHRIQAEVKRQEKISSECEEEIARLQRLVDAESKNPRYERRLEAHTPRFELLLGAEHANQLGGVTYIVKRKRMQHVVEIEVQQQPICLS